MIENRYVTIKVLGIAIVIATQPRVMWYWRVLTWSYCQCHLQYGHGTLMIWYIFSFIHNFLFESVKKWLIVFWTFKTLKYKRKIFKGHFFCMIFELVTKMLALVARKLFITSFKDKITWIINNLVIKLINLTKIFSFLENH